MINTTQTYTRTQTMTRIPQKQAPEKLDNLLDFTLPANLEASTPAEARGLRRDDVRLMVSYFQDDDRLMHSRFHDLPYYLCPGDVLVINTSGTLNAALCDLLTDAMIL